MSPLREPEGFLSVSCLCLIITTSKSTQEGTRAFVEGSAIHAFHTENEGALLRANYEQKKDPNNGWSKDRHFRKIASISALGMLMIENHHPDVKAPDQKDRDRAWHKVFMCGKCNQHGQSQWFTVPGGV